MLDHFNQLILDPYGRPMITPAFHDGTNIYYNPGDNFFYSLQYHHGGYYQKYKKYQQKLNK
jgi:hypothetical protein